MWSTRQSGPALRGPQIRARLIPLAIIVVALAHLAAGGGGQKATPVVTVFDVNPGTSVSRGLCLTIALGDAASECGDLRTPQRRAGLTRAPHVDLQDRCEAGAARDDDAAPRYSEKTLEMAGTARAHSVVSTLPTPGPGA